MIEGIPDDFRDLLVELVDAGARFLVVGGYAVAVREADAGPLGGVPRDSSTLTNAIVNVDDWGRFGIPRVARAPSSEAVGAQ